MIPVKRGTPYVPAFEEATQAFTGSSVFYRFPMFWCRPLGKIPHLDGPKQILFVHTSLILGCSLQPATCSVNHIDHHEVDTTYTMYNAQIDI